MTNQEWIDAALLELGIIEGDDSADSIESAKALKVMNQMMHAGEQSDMDFNWFTQDTLADIAPVPVWAEDGLISMLAVKCAVPFKANVDVILKDKEVEGRNLILRTLMLLKLEGADMSHLAYGTGKTGNNILTDL